MKQKISALIDGELDAREVREVCVSMRKDGELRYACSTYALIGDALRSEPYLATEIGGAVVNRLAGEPVVFAPGGQSFPDTVTAQQGRWIRPALAMAATVTGVAVVGWFGLTSQSQQESSALAKQSGVPQPVMVATASNIDPSVDMQEYLIAHQIQSGSVFLNGDTQHIRTVSLAGATAR